MATIKDIARECGVSAMTVSAVLNDKRGEVSEPTRQRVLEASRRLKYRPNAVARRLVGKKINTIGIADRFADPASWARPYESPLFEGILAASRRHRWDILYFAGHRAEDFDRSLPAYLDGRCDGMIFFSHNLTLDEADQLIETDFPIVLIGDIDNVDKLHGKLSVVDVDNARAAYEAVDHLIKLGHRRIAMFQGFQSAGNAVRMDAYRRALADAGIPFNESLIYPTTAIEDAGHGHAKRLLALPEAIRPTAVFCFNDCIAFGVLRAALELGVSVPDELSVVGFDDTDPAATTVPPLTTIRQPLRQVGDRAIDIILGLIRGDVKPGYSEIVPHELVIRGSTAPPAIRD